MKMVMLSLCLLLLLCENSYPQSGGKRLFLEIGTAFNISRLNWSIAGNLEGNSPNILSELKFNDIISFGTYVRGQYYPIKSVVVSVYFNQNSVIKGTGTDTDYKDDNRINPVFEKDFESNEGHFKLVKSGIGTPIYVSYKIQIIPSINYFLTKQRYYILSQEIQDLRSIYQANIQGSEIAIETNLNLHQAIYSSLTLSYHYVNYRAEADWNLIDSFEHPLSFSHDSKGFGFGVNMLVGYKLNNIFSFLAGGSLNATTIRRGIDTSYLRNGEEILTQFNGAKNTFGCVSFGIRVSL
tara:strand:+ start:9695 stop:10579 length:885 start_codon:yes stop_codon:yes gene_type:complete